jgi:hypothetical protein
MVLSRRCEIVSCYYQVLASHELARAGLIALWLARELKDRGQARGKAQALGLSVYTYSPADIFSS